MNAVELRNVTKRFGAVTAVRGLSLSVQKGSLLAVSGPSGCGKTTLLRLIAGLERPDKGEIALFGQCASGPRIHVAPQHRDAGFAFQDFALWPHMTVAKHLDFVLKSRKSPKPERVLRIAALLETLELNERRGAFPASLSGGEQQRVAIARAMAAEPSILLLDEPFANLDSRLRGRVLNEVLRLRREAGCTVIITSHDTESFERHADGHLRLGK